MLPDPPLLRMLGRPTFGEQGALFVHSVPMELDVQVLAPAAANAPRVRHAHLRADAPAVRRFQRPALRVQTYGWTFPTPRPDLPAPMPAPRLAPRSAPQPHASSLANQHNPILAGPTASPTGHARIRARPTAETRELKDRLLYLLQPPIDGIFAGRQLDVPFDPFPYQLEGIAFLLPRHAALLADEMGLGKTVQTILALRLLFHQGLIRTSLLICPKPLVPNWCRELRLWAPDIPLEVIAGHADERRRAWQVSNAPLKLVNYETLCRDVELLPETPFSVVVLDEAQRIKNNGSRTAAVVTAIRRERSWALTGTPIENHPDDLVNLFAFIDPGRVPADCPARLLPGLTSDCILRRTKELVQADMPPKMIADVELELTEAQREAYNRAESEGVVHLNALGDTITVQHVFQLVLRLKQICNFDPLTGQSAKLEHLLAEIEEVAASGRKAMIFSQWVEPLQILAAALQPFQPLQYHGRVPQPQRQAILDRFRDDPTSHVLLMTYGTGSVGLNLQFVNYVFLFDRWWNPAVEDQAINRAHRIGQRNPVLVKRYLSANTIERRIADVLEAKRKLFNDLLCPTDRPAAPGLTEEDIFGLFGLQVRPRSGSSSTVM